jgi:hypothetical protein
MKKIFIICIALAFLLGVTVTAMAGLKEISDAGVKGQKFIQVVDAIKSFNNTICPIVDSLEAGTGVDLKSVTDNQIQVYFSGITLSQAQIDVVQEAAIASDSMCEYIDTLALPATDN